MKTIKIFTFFLCIILLPNLVFSQDTLTSQLDEQVKNKLEILQKQLMQIEIEEKNKLKSIISELNAQQTKDSIYSLEDFETIKMDNAKRIAENIKNRQAIVQNQIDFLKRNNYLPEEVDNVLVDKDHSKSNHEEEESDRFIDWTIEINSKDDTDKEYRTKTQGDLIFAIGLNNAIPSDGGINDSPFKVGGSRFFEIGYIWSRPISKNNFLRLDYGFSFQFNGLKPEDNQVFVENGKQTDLETFAFDLDKSKFRQDNLIFPIYLHFNTKKMEEGYYVREGFNFGLGGFLGLNLKNVQKLKYENNGDNQKDKIKDDFNTNNFLYGLNIYAGYGSTTLYVTYTLNPIFKDNPVEFNNVQLGLRFAF